MLCDQLAKLRPDTYGGWNPEQLAAVLAPLGLGTVQLNQVEPDGQRHNWRGVRREDLTATVAARTERRGITR